EGGLNDKEESFQEDKKKKVDENNPLEEVHRNEEGLDWENRFDLLFNMKEDLVVDEVEEQRLQKILFQDERIQRKPKTNSTFDDDDDAMTSRFKR
ncbi:UNVERIFIED_CONTAM: hypothetical protein Sindi_0062000, partial [Sesamum indicum]